MAIPLIQTTISGEGKVDDKAMLDISKKMLEKKWKEKKNIFVRMLRLYMSVVFPLNFYNRLRSNAP